MELYSTSWHVISAMLIFVGGLIFSSVIGKSFRTSRQRSTVLYMWHTLFCIVYVFYVLNSGGDSIRYYSESLRPVVEFSVGTQAVNFITLFFSSVLGLSFLGTFLAYNLFGFVGLLAFDATLDALQNQQARA